MRRAAAAAGAFAACLPLLAVSALVPETMPVALVAAAALAAAVAARRLRRYAAAVAFAVFLVVVSPLADTARVETAEDLGAARFGLPFPFVEASLSASPPLPYDVIWSPLEDPARLLAGAFAGSLAVVVVAALLLAAAAANETVARAASRAGQKLRVSDGS